MKIEIHYQKIKDIEPQFIKLTTDEYFDPLEEDETFETDGVPKFNFAEEYLNLSVDELQWTDIRIQGTNNDHNIRTEYYKGGSSMWHRKDFDGNEEICVATQVSKSVLHIVRLNKTVDSNWRTVFNILSEKLDNGSEEETKFV